MSYMIMIKADELSDSVRRVNNYLSMSKSSSLETLVWTLVSYLQIRAQRALIAHNQSSLSLWSNLIHFAQLTP